MPVETQDAGDRFFARVRVKAGANRFTFPAHDVAGQTATATLDSTGTTPRRDRPELSGALDLTRLAPGYRRTSFDKRTATLFADLTVAHAGNFPVDAPLVVAVRNVSDPTGRPADTDGVTPDGLPYWDFSRLVPGATFDPGEVTGSRTISFRNPDGRRFTYELVVMARPNRAPDFTSVPDVKAATGRGYSYRVAAADPDGDPVAFSLSAAPAGAAVVSRTDPATGQTFQTVEWSPAAADVGSH